MRMRNPKDKDELLNGCDYFYSEENGFLNDNPIHLEIGMGKGQFLLNMAQENPDINFIGVEKYSSVLSVAIKKINEYKPSNLRVISGDIANLLDLFAGKIDVIYLNFSDPWPKDRHAKRRLTSSNYLSLYDKLFKGEFRIIQKTDNDDLFSFSLEEYKNYGYKINRISYDLHSEDISNVMTEYEEKFSNMGVKIKYVDVRK